jgi:hypothetical protein
MSSGDKGHQITPNPYEDVLDGPVPVNTFLASKTEKVDVTS